MCGIVGLLMKNPAWDERLGELLVPMLVGMTERGPDSAGMAVFGKPHAADRRAAELLPACTASRTGMRVNTAVVDAVPGTHRRRRHTDATRSSPPTPMARRIRALLKERSGSVAAVAGQPHRSLQGHRPARRHRRALSTSVDFTGTPRGGPHAHGHRVGRDARPCASVHGGRGLLPGAQRLAVESAPGAPPARATRHPLRDRQRHRGCVPLPRMAHARGRRAWMRPSRRASRRWMASSPS